MEISTPASFARCTASTEAPIIRSLVHPDSSRAIAEPRPLKHTKAAPARAAFAIVAASSSGKKVLP